MLRARNVLRHVALTIALILSAACAADSPGTEGERVERWSAEEDLRIGSVDDPRYSLTWFRSLVVSESGRMFTLHPQEQLIRSFDADGTFLRTIGGRGDGPDEFQNVFNMGQVGDTLWVLDGNGYSFKQFSEEGELLGTFTVPFVIEGSPDAASPPRASGLLSDGTVHGAPVAWSHLVAAGEVTHHVPMLMERDGTVSDTLPAIPLGDNQWAVYDPDNPRAGGSYGPQPFGDGPLWSYVPDERAIVRVDRPAPEVAEDAAFSVTKLSFSGDTIWKRELPFTPVALRRQEVDSVVEARAKPLGERGFLGLTVPKAREWAARTLYTPAFKPYVRSMVVGSSGSIWLETNAVSDSTEWMVLDPDGAPRAKVVLPEDLTVLEADREHVWGSRTDDLDVPYLVRYRIG